MRGLREYFNAMKTFYIASSSKNVTATRKLAARLEKRGMVWDYDWTIQVEASEDPSTAVDPDNAVRDMEAAADADLFVLLLSDHVTEGGHFELGVRCWETDIMGAESIKAHVIRNGKSPHFFAASLSHCIVHETVSSFLKYIDLQ